MSERVARHYEKADIVAAIEHGLRAAGKDPANLEPTDLAAIDEFHVRGRTATLELAERLGAPRSILDPLAAIDPDLVSDDATPEQRSAYAIAVGLAQRGLGR